MAFGWNTGGQCVRHLLCILLTLICITGCGDNGGESTADAGGSAPDVTDGDSASQDVAAPDLAPTADVAPDGGSMEPEIAAPDPCHEMIQLDTAFDLFPDESLTQIHASAIYDGEGIWVAYDIPDADKKFDVRAARISCAGEILVQPFTLNVTSVANELDPALALRGGTMLIAWQSDNGTGVNNMDIFWRTIAVDGTPVMTADSMLEITVDGVPQEGNAWMPSVAPTDGGFLISGAIAVDGAKGFQAAVQRVSDNGDTEGDAIVASFEAESSQVYPAMTRSADGTVHLAWTRTVVEGPEQVEYARLAPEATEFAPAHAVDSDVPTMSASLGAGGENVFLSYDEQSGKGLRHRCHRAGRRCAPALVRLCGQGRSHLAGVTH